MAVAFAKSHKMPVSETVSVVFHPSALKTNASVWHVFFKVRPDDDQSDFIPLEDIALDVNDKTGEITIPLDL
jgi:hypothetical protein